MKFLAKLATGQIALWRVFWFIGTPLTLIWLITGAAIVFLVGIPSLFVVGSIIGVFTLATLTIPFAAGDLAQRVELSTQDLVAHGAGLGRQSQRGILGRGGRPEHPRSRLSRL